MEVFGGGDFTRLRIGVGRSGPEKSVSDYVLGKFDAEERTILPRILEKARDAVASILCKGTRLSMNEFNKRIVISS
jgi:PTH1 family peptidyl-tRNA hydrolase